MAMTWGRRASLDGRFRCLASLVAGVAATSIPAVRAVPEPGSRLSGSEDVATESVHVLRLPEWEAEDERRFDESGRPVDLGGGLWPDEQIGLQELPLTLPDPGWPSLGSLRAGGGGRPVPGGAAEERDPAMDAWFGRERPDKFLVDPLGLVADRFRENIERFLRYHAHESSIETVVLVLEEGREVPADIDTSDVWTRWFGAGSGAIVLYQFGDPQATGVEFGRDLARRSGRSRLQGLLDACVDDALVTADPAAQLERFCVKFSIETYWLERDLRGEEAGGGTPSRPRVPSMRAAGAAAGDSSRLASGGGESGVSWTGAWMAVLLVVLAVAAGGGWWWLARRHRVVRFIEVEVPARLGGAHAGGRHAVIQFGRSPVPRDTPEAGGLPA